MTSLNSRRSAAQKTSRISAGRFRRERLVLVPELASSRGNKPDGTIPDALRMARGYWEAKDPHDDLDTEIQAKFNQGYPRDNIVFEDSINAVLFQDGAVAMRTTTGKGSRHLQLKRQGFA